MSQRMMLETALDEFELEQRRKHRGDEGRIAAMAFAALREFLIDDCGYLGPEQITPRDFYRFLLDYYPALEDAEPSVAAVLMDATSALALWLVEHGRRALAPFVEQEARLREDLLRMIEAQQLLLDHTRRDDLRTEAEIAEEMDEEEIVGSVGAGVNRTARLDQITYEEAQLEYFTVTRTAEGALSLSSVEREALGEGVAEPVRVPVRVAELFRPGDIIHAEIAPGPAGWELLEVFGVRPGGYP